MKSVDMLIDKLFYEEDFIDTYVLTSIEAGEKAKCLLEELGFINTQFTSYMMPRYDGIKIWYHNHFKKGPLFEKAKEDGIDVEICFNILDCFFERDKETIKKYSGLIKQFFEKLIENNILE